MSKKLLSEAQVRRFMGLAGIKPVNEMAYKHDDKKMEEYMSPEESEAFDKYSKGEDPGRPGLKEEDEPELDAAPGAPEDDMEAGDADVEMDEQDLADVADALDTLQTKLAPLLDQAEEAEADVDIEEEPPAPETDEVEIEKELQEVNMELTEEEIVNEVARRVAKRIVEAKRAHKKMNEALGRKK